MEKRTRGRVTLTGAEPIKFHPEDDANPVEISPSDVALLRAVSESIREYRRTAKELLQGRLSGLASLVPDHIRDHGTVLIALCSDGVIIRFEKNEGEPKLISGVFEANIASAAHMLSQYLVRVHSASAPSEFDPASGIEFAIGVSDSAGTIQHEVARTRIWFDVVNNYPNESLYRPDRPYRLLSVQSTFEMELHGELADEKGVPEGRPFIARKPFKLPVPWNCIEVYPGRETSLWVPDFARGWAESDIMAAAVSEHTKDAQLRALDPSAAARREFASLLQEFRELLDSEPAHEQILQTFLQKHPQVLCPSYAKMWPKLPLGARVTDFVFRDATNEYILVELESSSRTLFRKDGYAHADLTHAQGQVSEWKRYIEDNLSTVQRELGLTGISTNPRSLIVIGRSRDLDDMGRRRLTTMMNENPKLQVQTYDDVYQTAKAVVENLLGPLFDMGGNTQMYFPRP